MLCVFLVVRRAEAHFDETQGRTVGAMRCAATTQRTCDRSCAICASSPTAVMSDCQKGSPKGNGSRPRFRDVSAGQ